MDTVAMAPKWLFALLFETYGWLAAPAPPVVATHVLTLAALKRPIMQALGLWRPTLVLPPTVRVPSPTCNAAPLTLSHSLSHTLSRVGNLGDSRAIIGRNPNPNPNPNFPLRCVCSGCKSAETNRLIKLPVMTRFRDPLYHETNPAISRLSGLRALSDGLNRDI